MVKDALANGFTQARRILEGLISLPGSPLREHFNLALLAFVLSASLWVFITNEQNPPRTGTFPQRVPVHPVNVPHDLAVLGDIEPLEVRITAPVDLWNRLTEASFDATVDLSEVTQGTFRRAVRVQARDARVRVLLVTPSSVQVELDSLARKTVPVRINILQGPPLGFSNQLPRVEPQQAVVLGPQRLVELVENAVMEVNLINSRANFRQSLSLIPQAQQGYEIEGVRIEPSQGTVELAITRHVNFVSLPVVVDLLGAPAPGYWVSQVRTTPPIVSALGPQDVLQSLTFFKTQPIDLAGASASYSRRIALTLPQGVTLPDRSDIQVDITIQPLQNTAVFQVAPQILGLTPGLRARSESPSVAVTIGGEGPALQNLIPDALRIFLNVDGRGQGTYQIALQINLPPGLRVLRMEPETVSVVIN